MKELFTFEEEASRIELFIRIIYAFILSIVIGIYGFVAGLCILIQFFVVLILGRRSKGLSDFIKGYLEYYVHVSGYVYFMTDERPGILPVPVLIYEEEKA